MKSSRSKHSHTSSFFTSRQTFVPVQLTASKGRHGNYLLALRQVVPRDPKIVSWDGAVDVVAVGVVTDGGVTKMLSRHCEPADSQDVGQC